MGHAAGLLQPPGDGAQLSPEGPLSPLALAQPLLQLPPAGLGSSLQLLQLPPQPQDLREGRQGSRPGATGRAPRSLTSRLGASQPGGPRACLEARVWQWGALSAGGVGHLRPAEHVPRGPPARCGPGLPPPASSRL